MWLKLSNGFFPPLHGNMLSFNYFAWHIILRKCSLNHFTKCISFSTTIVVMKLKRCGQDDSFEPRHVVYK